MEFSRTGSNRKKRKKGGVKVFEEFYHDVVIVAICGL